MASSITTVSPKQNQEKAEASQGAMTGSRKQSWSEKENFSVPYNSGPGHIAKNLGTVFDMC